LETIILSYISGLLMHCFPCNIPFRNSFIGLWIFVYLKITWSYHFSWKTTLWCTVLRRSVFSWHFEHRGTEVPFWDAVMYWEAAIGQCTAPYRGSPLSATFKSFSLCALTHFTHCLSGLVYTSHPGSEALYLSSGKLESLLQTQLLSGLFSLFFWDPLDIH
jgi:hypothetical protein